MQFGSLVPAARDAAITLMSRTSQEPAAILVLASHLLIASTFASSDVPFCSSDSKTLARDSLDQLLVRPARVSTVTSSTGSTLSTTTTGR